MSASLLDLHPILNSRELLFGIMESAVGVHWCFDCKIPHEKLYIQFIEKTPFYPGLEGFINPEGFISFSPNSANGKLI